MSWVVLDSKTEGTFRLHFERINVPGTPPANDRWEDAEVIASLPAVITGSTIDATAESLEEPSEEFSIGPIATVWYKLTPTRDGQITITGYSTELNEGYVYVDVWAGPATDASELTRIQKPVTQGFFARIEDVADNRDNTITFNVLNGEDYWIRVQTEEHSEDFTLYVDEQTVYIDIQAEGLDTGPYADSGEVYVDISVSSVDEFHGTFLDAETVPITITPITTYEAQGKETVDSATVYVDIRNVGGECYSTHTGAAMDTEADPRWTTEAFTRWTTDAELRWSVGDIETEGVHC